MFKQAKRYEQQVVAHFCMESIRTAGFDHPLFYGYENFISFDLLTQYKNLFYHDKMPLFHTLQSINYPELLQGLETLKYQAIIALCRRHSCTEIQARPLFNDTEINHLLFWIAENEVAIYSLLYAYKRYRITHRVVPSFEVIRQYLV